MKNLKRMLAATLAMTVLFATSVMAQTPREILSQAYANSADATAMAMTGNIAGAAFLSGVEIMQMDMDIAMDIDLDAGTMKMYMRMPVQISITDPETDESIDISTEVAIFMDGATLIVYQSDLGWFTDDSMDLGDMGEMFALISDMEDMTAWFMDINEQIMDEITIQFADDQVDGFYVIESFMDWDDMMSMMDMLFTPELFDSMFAFMPGLDDFDVAELYSEMDEMMAMLDGIDFDLQAVYRSYIDVETLNFERYLMDMTLDFVIDGSLDILSDLDLPADAEITGNFVISFEIDYDPTITWPVIDNVRTLDEIMAELLENIEIIEMTLDADSLEERLAFTFDGDTTAAVATFNIEEDASFNVFIVNHGNEAVSVGLFGVFTETLQGGEGFVMQVPAGTLDGAAIVFVEGADGPIDVETGFRLTNYPLGS